MAEAIPYALAQWTELKMCSVPDGAVPIDNNVSEPVVQ